MVHFFIKKTIKRCNYRIKVKLWNVVEGKKLKMMGGIVQQISPYSHQKGEKLETYFRGNCFPHGIYMLYTTTILSFVCNDRKRKCIYVVTAYHNSRSLLPNCLADQIEVNYYNYINIKYICVVLYYIFNVIYNKSSFII